MITIPSSLGSMSAEDDLVSEANHRIANHLTILLAALQDEIEAISTGPETIPRETAGEGLRGAAAKIMAVAHLHRRLSLLEPDDFVDLGEFLSDAVDELARVLTPGNRISMRRHLASDCLVEPDEAATLVLMLCEIVTNAVKHAHPAKAPLKLELTCMRSADGGTMIEIGDDGVGLPEGFDPVRDGGTGMKVILRLAERLFARLTIDSSDLGLRYRIVLPE